MLPSILSQITNCQQEQSRLSLSPTLKKIPLNNYTNPATNPFFPLHISKQVLK
ncbi:MAG: hypothetical protein LBK82_08950 [Planctomycetaceae bacterium]|nr:hypothetical protein [Planctomycetaceae bacterium]